MHKIQKIELVGTDQHTSANAKLIYSTGGDFYSRTFAYNQTFERYEKTLVLNGSQSLGGIPLTILTLRYLFFQKERSLHVDIKSLTHSRLSNDGGLFLKEVERIKKYSFTNKRTILYYLQVPVEEWASFTFDDLETVSLVLINAGVPHVTIPLHPKKTFVENATFFERMKMKLKDGQDIIPQFVPKMRKREGKQLLQKIFTEPRSMMTLVAGYSPTNENHAYFYSFIWKYHPRGKLLIAADVSDRLAKNISVVRTEHLLPTASILKRFGFDIICRKVSIPIGQKFAFPVSPESTYIYDDQTGAMLAESDQERWHGRSATALVMETMPACLGIDFRQYVLCYNFIKLNATGLNEADHIMKKIHRKYIEERPILAAYYGVEDG